MSKVVPLPRLTTFPLAAILAMLPVAALATQNFCAASSVIPILAAIRHRMTEVPASRPTSSEAELLAKTVALAHELADPRLRMSAFLDPFSLEDDLRSDRSAPPMLSSSERRQLEFWTAICESWFLKRQNGVSRQMTGASWPPSVAHRDGIDGEESSQTRWGRAQRFLSVADVGSQGGQPASQTSRVATAALLGLVAILISLILAMMRLAARDARRVREYTCGAPSSVRIGSQKVFAVAVNLSQRRCKLRVPGPLPARATCGLRIDDIWVEARVVWSNQHYTTVKFCEQLPLSVVTSLVGEDPRGAAKRNHGTRACHPSRDSM